MRGFFLSADPGLRFCLHHPPADGVARGMLLYVHPWAEEMNRSRRMAALQAREFSRHGLAVLQIDLLGCGDSSGDFADATWQHWLHDVEAGVRWLRGTHGDLPLWLWGLRAGTLLASAAAARLGDQGVGLLLWQPVVAGKSVLQQFLRMRAAAEMQSGDPKGAVARLRAELAEGRPVDVAGYRLSPALAHGLEAAQLQPPAPGRRALWLEVGTRTPAALLPASAACVDAWRAAGAHVETAAVNGPAFWQTQEIEDAPELVAATSTALAAAA